MGKAEADKDTIVKIHGVLGGEAVAQKWRSGAFTDREALSNLKEAAKLALEAERVPAIPRRRRKRDHQNEDGEEVQPEGTKRVATAVMRRPAVAESEKWLHHWQPRLVQPTLGG